MKVTMVILFALILGLSANAADSTNKVPYIGQGLNSNPDGFGGYDLNTELCGVANGADADGPYLLWVLTANKATVATITGPFGVGGATMSVPMARVSNGSFKFVSGWLDPKTVPLVNVVYAMYDGAAKNAQLVISHGCRPKGSGWCSPGFWHNATDAAWALTGFAKGNSFNSNVPPFWFGTLLSPDNTLLNVVNNASTYSGPPNPGTSGYALNAFNAVGAFLTDHIPGFHFDINLITVPNADNSNTCPIDHFGNFKQ